MKRYLIVKTCVLLLFLISASCSESYQENPYYEKKYETVELTEEGELIIALDSLTPYYTDCIQYYETPTSNDSTNFLITFNKPRSTIDFYSYRKELAEFSFRINLKDTSIPNPNNIDGFSYINGDSIVVVSSSTNKFFLISDRGVVLNEFQIRSNVLSNFFSNPIISTNNPVYKLKNRIYISGFLGQKIDIMKKLNPKVDNLNIQVSLETGTILPQLSYSDAYLDKRWSPNMLYFYRCYNEDTKNFVYSFPADHNLMVTNLEGDPTYFLAGSKYFKDIYTLKKSEVSSSTDREIYYYKTPSYGPVIYDKFQKVYYRVALQRISEEDLNSKDAIKSTIKQVSIIILDEKFKKIGETVLPRFSYTETMFFVNERGLHLGKWEKSKINEDELVFGVFKLKVK